MTMYYVSAKSIYTSVVQASKREDMKTKSLSVPSPYACTVRADKVKSLDLQSTQNKQPAYLTFWNKGHYFGYFGAPGSFPRSALPVLDAGDQDGKPGTPHQMLVKGAGHVLGRHRGIAETGFHSGAAYTYVRRHSDS